MTNHAPTAGGQPRPRFLGAINRHHTEIAAAILLSIATVLTAWCAYQATRWSGVQSIRYAEASAARVESTRAFNRSMQLTVIDAGIFVAYAEAYSLGNEALTEFFESRVMRPEFAPFFDSWLATNPLENPEADRNPFDLPGYREAIFAESDALEAVAGAKFAEGLEANQTGDDYVLATVLFAAVLFFAGISSKFESLGLRSGMLVMAVVMLALGSARFGTLPIH